MQATKREAHHQSPFQLTRRRQWGAERRTEPLPILHNKPTTRQIVMSRVAIIATIAMWLLYVVNTVVRQFFEGPHTFRFTMEAIGYVFVVTMLTFSALLYLITRQGALVRFAKHRRTPRAELDAFFATKQPSITVLVPSYDEETAVIGKTLLSAALQEYPGMRVVLLIDDKPYPTNEAVLAKLNETRAVSKDIMKLLAKPRARYAKALKEYERLKRPQGFANAREIETLQNHYETAAQWLESHAVSGDIDDHVDLFFYEQVFFALAKDLRLVTKALDGSLSEGAHVSYARMHQLYRRLAWIFDADISVFERKKYASLSHEANKAMNLNSYISLMGGSYAARETATGTVLVPTTRKSAASLTVPDSDYVLTLDADSILLREYCLRLVYLLEQPGNERIAVTQTPYSSFRGASTRIERLAAATTDIQHILHQGMTEYSATFWVGANAVIRKKALEDIVETDIEDGFEIKRYVQDRTVIEDTESSIDLKVHGWTLMNYPERLSYSATPPDFGSLVVQRRRWANGGLLILPKLFAHNRERIRNNEAVSRMEVLLRVNYMASIAWSSFGLIFLLAFPYDGRLLSPFVILAALPYFLAMASDLKYCGYKGTDVFRIYGFNLILLPVNLAGVLKSIQQALTSKKIPFARTPKVKNRTATPLLYIIIPLLIIAFSVMTLYRDLLAENWGNAAFAGFNAIVATWAFIAYIGVWNSIVDIWLGLTDWMYVDVKPKQAVAKSPATDTLDWRAMLYHGDTSTKNIPISAHEHFASPTPTKR